LYELFFYLFPSSVSVFSLFGIVANDALASLRLLLPYAFSCCLDQFPQRSLSCSPTLQRGAFYWKAGAKIIQIISPSKYFFAFLKLFLLPPCVHHVFFRSS
jgi:hypothetical protein